MKKPLPARRSLSDHDFTILKTPTSQTNGLVYGDSGTGKSTFVLRYCPGPIAFINFDRRADDLILENQDRGKSVKLARIEFVKDIQGLTEDKAKSIAKESVDKALHNFSVAVEWARKGKIRTICLDTGTEFDELLSIRYRGNVGSLQNDYGASKGLMNRQWLTMFRRVRGTKAHFIVLARAKELWERSEPIGIFEPVISSKVSDAVDWKANLSLSVTRNGKPKFTVKVTKSGSNITEIFKRYTDRDWGELGPFVYLCRKQYPKRDPKQWCDDAMLEILDEEKKEKDGSDDNAWGEEDGFIEESNYDDDTGLIL